MSYTQTPNYGFIKPNVNADDDLWGDHLNQNADQLDSIIHGIDTRPAGGVQSFNTRVGAITLQGTDVTTALGYTPYNVTNPAGYQTAGQVSSALGAYLPLTGGQLTGALSVPSGGVTTPSLALGAIDGTGISRSGAAIVLGVTGQASLALFPSGGQFYGPLNMLNAKVQTLGDATAAQDALNLRTADARYAPLASPAFTGNPTAPTPAPGDNDTSLATTAFVTAAVSAGSVAGVASFNTRTGAVVLSTTDVQSALGFAPAPLNAPVFTGDARAVTPAAGDADTSIATTAFVAAAVAPAGNNAGRNLLHNALFNVAQRGISAINGVVGAVTYTADRWFIVPGSAGDVMSAQILPHSDANRATIGDEAAEQFITIGVTGGAGASNICNFTQRIEDVRRLAGKTVTISFWCSATAARVGVSLAQLMGGGGSPSADVYVPGQIVTETGTFTRYSVTFTLPSLAGKTLGTNGNHSTQLAFTLSNGGVANYPAVGAQSGTFNFWGVQLEVGTQATPLDYGGSPQQQLAQCQRFYQVGQMGLSGYTDAGGNIYFSNSFPVVMRAAPTVTTVGNFSSNVGPLSWIPNTPTNSGIVLAAAGIAVGGFVLNATYTASADL